MAHRNLSALEALFDILTDAPWWTSLLVGGISYAALRFAFPVIWSNPKTMLGILAGASSQLAWISVILALPAMVSMFKSAGKRRMLDRQNGIGSIRSLSWKQFEELLGEAYRRQGFTVSENPGMGVDGGIDLTIKRGDDTYLVQCKHWKTRKVGVKVVREMLGLMTAHSATGAIIVTSGVFTKEAIDFAAAQHIKLVNGDGLVRMIGALQTTPAITSVSSALTVSARRCPRCGKDQALRTARRGANTGAKFWGCSNFPNCRYTEVVSG